MESIRKPSIQEENFIEFLIKKSSLSLSPNWKVNLLVKPMNDGGMGSLYLFPNGVMLESRLFGRQVSEYFFKDEDGIDVITSLNVDKEGNLFELDIWKTNYSRLIKIPESFG